MERTLEGRVQSFSKSKGSKSTSSKASSSLVWPHPNTYAANPQTLAEAGFFFCPDKDDPDNVRCFMCEKELGGWDKDDNPFEIHINKSPKCPWAVARCSLEFDVDQNGDFSIKNPARLPMNKLLEKARLDTFGGKQKWWPHDSAKSHGATSKKMAKAGFVYTPQVPGDDTATCFYCDLSLSGWDEDDDPAEEHRKREERSGKPCPFFHAKVQIAPSGSKAASRKSKAAPQQSEVATEDSEIEKLAPAPAKKGKQKSTVNGSMPPPSNASSTSRKKVSKAYTSHDEESQDDHDGDSAASKPARKGGKSKSVAKGKTPLEMVSEVEEEAPLPKPPRSKTPASKKAPPAADKPPSNVNGKIAKQQQQQYTDVTIGLNDEEERQGRSKDKGLSRSTSTRSKSKPRSTAGSVKPSSSRSRSQSRAASRSKATDAEDEDEETLEPEPEPEAESVPVPKPKARRQTKAKPTATELSDVEDPLTVKPKGKRQTRTKKTTESESEDAIFIVKNTKAKPQKKPPSTALDVSGTRAPSEKPPSTSAMDIDELQPTVKASVPPSSKKRTATKKGGGSKSSSSSSPSLTLSAGSAEPASSRGAQREREPANVEERLETLEEEVYDDGGMQVDHEEADPVPEAPPVTKPASKPVVKKKIETKTKPMDLEEIGETDESAPPSRPVSAASVRETTTTAAAAVAPTTTAPAKPKAKPTSNGKTKDNSLAERSQAAEEATMDVDVDDSTAHSKKSKPRSDAPAPVPVLQPAARIKSDKSGFRPRPATPERRPLGPPKVALTLTSPPASPTRSAHPSPHKAAFLLPAVADPVAPKSTSASIPTNPSPPPSPPPPVNGIAGPPAPPPLPTAPDNNNENDNDNDDDNTTTNPLALFIPPLASAPLHLAQALTDAERAMTVEQWIRHEMDVQYAALQRDGEMRIAAFRAAAEEARRQIEAL